MPQYNFQLLKAEKFIEQSSDFHHSGKVDGAFYICTEKEACGKWIS